jgi:hypothetical protein
VFRGDADELFQLYHQAHYLNEIATAGKAEFDIPLYMNVWLSYPPAELPERRLPIPGIQYPSGGAVQRWVGLWRALAPSISAIAPDIYGDDAGFVLDVLAAYHRPDNPLLVPEIAKIDSFARYDFLALGGGHPRNRPVRRRSQRLEHSGRQRGSGPRKEFRSARADGQRDREIEF